MRKYISHLKSLAAAIFRFNHFHMRKKKSHLGSTAHGFPGRGSASWTAESSVRQRFHRKATFFFYFQDKARNRLFESVKGRKDVLLAVLVATTPLVHLSRNSVS